MVNGYIEGEFVVVGYKKIVGNQFGNVEVLFGIIGIVDKEVFDLEFEISLMDMIGVCKVDMCLCDYWLFNGCVVKLLCDQLCIYVFLFFVVIGREMIDGYGVFSMVDSVRILL